MSPNCILQVNHRFMHRALRCRALQRLHLVPLHPTVIVTIMSETMENRGSKRACLESQAETTGNALKQWCRLFSKLRFQMHLEQVVKVLISLAIPLMPTLKQVMAVMIREADPEEMEVIQDMVTSMVQEKKHMEKGYNRKSNKKVKGSPRSKTSTSVGSFEVISECSPPSRKLRASSSTQMAKLCFCGLTPNQAVSSADPVRLLRMDGGHQGGGVREALCPECFYGEVSIAQAHKEEVKARLRDRLQHFKRRRLGLSSESGISFPKDSAKSGQMSARVEPQENQCLHQHEDMSPMWPSRDLRYKDGLKTTNYVDVSKIKKSGRPRASSP